MNLTADLGMIRDEIKERALALGLDPFETLFELVEFDEINEIASFGGFPTRYPHWRFGMQFEELQKGYIYGLQKIYELVINNDPCYAYLMRCNPIVDQKMVIAHVYGHSDFFKNNLWFARTNRRMVDEMANHGTRLRRHIERHGEEAVETFLDACLSLENLIDAHSVYSPRRRAGRFEGLTPETEPDHVVRKLKSKDYMDRFVNPPSFVEKEKKKIDAAAKKKKHFPNEPERDILLFLIEHAPHLDDWQRDVLSIVREEAYYFAPQAMTKIMNEGWASYWHSTLMTRLADGSEIVDYADHHSGTMGMRPGTLNPYKIGIELFRDIEDRWNKGKFGRDYDACDDAAKRKRWDLGLGLGRKKIFEVRRVYNDVTFIDEFLTKEFCEEQKLFVYKHNPQSNRYEIADRDFAKIKQELLFRLTNSGYPIIKVVDGNYGNRGELHVRHFHEGVDMDLLEAKDTLKNLLRIWNRPVHLETLLEGEKKLYSFDGDKVKEQNLGE